MNNPMLDTDLYIFTMGIFAKYRHQNIIAEYVFKCRNNVDLTNITDTLIKEIKTFINNARFTNEQIDYLNSILENRAEYLREYVNNPLPINFNDFVIYSKNHELIVRAKGPLWAYIFIEVPLLYKVNELYNNYKYNTINIDELYNGAEIKLDEKIKLLNKNPGVKIMEFGTRRRFSKEWQKHVLLRLLNETNNIVGTSNVELAKEFGISPLGTTAHLYSQVYQALTHPLDAQKLFFKEWSEFWGDKFLIALTDIFPQQKFLKDFNKELANKYQGVRHDSGDPKIWCREIIEHYKSNEIDPKTKTAIFSDGLDIPMCIDLYNEFHDKINVIFGVGTNLTNDMGMGHQALQIVMKVVEINGRAVAKLSNNPGKTMCENMHYVQWLTQAIQEDVNNG